MLSDDNPILTENLQQSATPFPLEGALLYADMGIPIFPCTAEKKPYTKHGFKDASTDTGQINIWLEKYTDAFIGMPTGEKSGIMVLDVDMPDGEESLAALIEKHGSLPPTTEVRTQSAEDISILSM